MSEGAPKPERYKSKWDEEGNFIWKDGISFMLGPDPEKVYTYILDMFVDSTNVGKGYIKVMKGRVDPYIVIDPKYRGENLGSSLLEGVNELLDYLGLEGVSSNKIGSMGNHTIPTDVDAVGMQARHGWVKDIDYKNTIRRMPKSRQDS